MQSVRVELLLNRNDSFTALKSWPGTYLLYLIRDGKTGGKAAISAGEYDAGIAENRKPD